MIDEKLAAEAASTNGSVLLLRDIAFDDVASLLTHYGLRLQLVADGAPIPGSYWGEPEAGIIGATVHARSDTPVHSLLHEASHLIVLDPARRAVVHTDATDSIAEEDAVCVLQSLLGDALPGVGADRVLADMDAWGYTFRLGSARAYVGTDAESAWKWLVDRGLLDVRRRLVVPGSLPDLHPPAASTSLR
ncbi:hypothetical protein [Cognatiluteimonas profundi]|uniref:hypothetical protein n=1 Tax=Cognatiluteimonas profundi TaxID=2594501 RepID=UPI001E594F9D|nr:hypothetical protein [Lysobacter profundi]